MLSAATIQSLRRAGPYCLAVLILLFAFYIRSFAFWLPHWQGDQSQNVTLAMKLDALGLDGYNLERVSVRFLTLPDVPDQRIVYPQLLPEGEKGDLYRAYQIKGLDFYNKMTFFAKAPLYPWALVASHNYFADVDQPYSVVETQLGRRVLTGERPAFFKAAQFWAVFVSMASSLGVILLTFIVGSILLDKRSGLLAAFLMAIHPVPLLTSYKLLADDMATLLVTASFLGFFLAYRKRTYLGMFFSGILCGLAVLTKQNMGSMLGGIAVYMFLDAWARSGDAGTALKRVLTDGLWWSFVAGAALVSAGWFIKIYQVYGTPIYEADAAEQIAKDLTGWFGLLKDRPGVLWLYLVSTPFLCPPFFLSHLSVRPLFRDMRDTVRGASAPSQVIFLWCWVLSFLVFFLLRYSAKEERYLLPLYPALSILSAFMFWRFRGRFARYFASPLYLDVLLALLVVAVTAWSVPVGLTSAFEDRFLILDPLRNFFVFYGFGGS